MTIASSSHLARDAALHARDPSVQYPYIMSVGLPAAATGVEPSVDAKASAANAVIAFIDMVDPPWYMVSRNRYHNTTVRKA